MPPFTPALGRHPLPRLQRELDAALRALELALDERNRSKTEQVLTHLLQRETSV